MRHNSSVLFALALASFVGLGLGASGCSDNQIGRLCNDPTLNVDGGSRPTSGINVVSPAPDCPARLCITTPPPLTTTPGVTRSKDLLSVCTASCNSDADCATSSDYSTSSTCTQFVCAYPSIIPTDALCCKKVCMCKSDVPSFAKDPTAGKMLTRDADGVPRPDRCADPVAACSLPK